MTHDPVAGLRRVRFPCCFLGALVWGAAIAGAQTNREASRSVVLSEAEQAWVQKHPVVYWGVDPQWPPFSFFDKHGNISGIDVEIVKLLAKRTGLNMELVRTADWTETLQKAGSGQIDFVGGIAHTKKREHLYGLKFTEVYREFPTAIVTRKDTPFLALMCHLKTNRITLPRNYATTEELMRLYPEVRLELTDSEEQSMLLVAGNKADATALNLASAGYIVHTRGLSNVKISGFTEIDFFLCLAVRKGAPELRSILQKGLETIDAREKEAIYASYIHPETLAAINWRTWRRRALYSILVGAAVLTAVLLRNRRLAREIRQRKSVEATLMQARDKLEADARELDRRACEVEVLNKKLSLANKDLESFSYSVSHDLKSPLRRLRGFAELLELDAGTSLDPAARQHLGVIHREGERMSEMIDALLELARIEHAPIRLERVKLEDLAREVIRDVTLETRGREILWEVHPLPEVECDRRLMKQVFANLVDNAVKFTRKSTPARIEIGVLPEKTNGDQAVCYVRDNGAGFEPKSASALFETFRRLHRQEDYEGSGIGLTNVKRIIQKHGGRVWAEGELGKGATFYFSLARRSGQGTDFRPHLRPDETIVTA